MKIKAIAALLLALALLLFTACGSTPEREIERPWGIADNLGVSHFIININNGETEYIPASIDDIVPAREALIEALREKGYVIEESATALDSDIPAQRVYAHKDRHYVDICYGLTEEQAKTALPRYEAAYESYILMAQNEKYVYCISDREAFFDAGFTSLANRGIQHIRD